MAGIPQDRSSRRLAAGSALVAAAILAVLTARGAEKPWIPNSPAYRQKGPSNAKVTLVEFSDFQCPACARAVQSVKQLEALYGPNLRILYKHHPWYFHRWAKKAALAAECAGRQGKFWELHDLLFSKQTEWGESDKGDEMIASYAHEVGMDPAAYAQCLQDPSAMAAIDSDLREAEDHWVNSTPTFFINGQRYALYQLGREGMLQIERTLSK